MTTAAQSTNRRHPAAAIGLAAAAIVTLALPLGLATPANAAPDDDEQDARLIMVMDASGSMEDVTSDGSTRIVAAREAMHTALGAVDDDREVGMSVFGGQGGSLPEACTDSQVVVPIGSGNRAELSAAIDAYAPRGHTPIGYALQQAGEELGGSGQRSILLVSDGVANCDPDPCEVAADLVAGGIDLTINVVGLGVDDDARNQLRCISEAGNGTYLDANDTESLTAALDVLVTRAFRPFTISGIPVDGVPHQDGDAMPADAPVLSPGSQYADEIPPERQGLMYRIERETPGSTLHVGFTAMAMDETAVIYVEMYDGGGDRCFFRQTIGMEGPYSLMSTNGIVTAARDGREDPCVDGDGVFLRIYTHAWNVLGSAPFELEITEEPPATTTVDLPGQSDAPDGIDIATSRDGTGGEIEPGTSFNDAPVVEPGSYRGSVLTGETQTIGVDVGWGQRLQVAIDFDDLSPAQADVVSGGTVLRALIGVTNPVRGDITETPGDSNTSGNMSFVMPDQQNSVSATMREVSYANRWVDLERPVLAGTHTVTLAMDTVPEAFVLPYTVTIEVVGDEQGIPDYAELEAGEAEQPTATEAPAAAPDVVDDGGFPWVPTLIGAGGVLVLAAGAWWLVWALRRRDSRTGA